MDVQLAWVDPDQIHWDRVANDLKFNFNFGILHFEHSLTWFVFNFVFKHHVIKYFWVQDSKASQDHRDDKHRLSSPYFRLRHDDRLLFFSKTLNAKQLKQLQLPALLHCSPILWRESYFEGESFHLQHTESPFHRLFYGHCTKDGHIVVSAQWWILQRSTFLTVTLPKQSMELHAYPALT